jgi:hypothetical protein
MTNLLRFFLSTKRNLCGLIVVCFFVPTTQSQSQEAPEPIIQYLSGLPVQVKVSVQANRLDGTLLFAQHENQQTPLKSFRMPNKLLVILVEWWLRG